jgi:membrane protein
VGDPASEPRRTPAAAAGRVRSRPDDGGDGSGAQSREQARETAREARERLENLRERFDPQIERVSSLTRRTMELFPVRVWRRFLAQNGFILSAGMSYQALFAVFAAVYVVFAVAGIWLTGNEEALDAFATLVNTYAPGLIGPEGVISEDDLVEVAKASTSLFGLTGAVALGGLIWTAISWITYTRMAVRSMFGLPKDTRNYVLLKTRDFLAGFAFGAALLVASALSIAAVSVLDWLVGLLGWDLSSTWSEAIVQLGSLIIVFIIDTLALAVMFRFLSGAAMPWRRMWVGSLLGSVGLTTLQVFGGLLVTGAGKNPLLATFAVFIGLLLWFRFASIVILVAAAWIAIEAEDAHESLRRLTPEQLEAERIRREREAVLVAARVKVRRARDAADSARWFERPLARVRLARAEAELAAVEEPAAAPGPAEPPPNGRRRNDVGGLP